jgi:hypothetical protein
MYVGKSLQSRFLKYDCLSQKENAYKIFNWQLYSCISRICITFSSVLWIICSHSYWEFLFLVWFGFETMSHYVVHVGLEFTTLLPQSLGCWDCRHAPSCLAIWGFCVLLTMNRILSLQCLYGSLNLNVSSL